MNDSNENLPNTISTYVFELPPIIVSEAYQQQLAQKAADETAARNLISQIVSGELSTQEQFAKQNELTAIVSRNDWHLRGWELVVPGVSAEKATAETDA